MTTVNCRGGHDVGQMGNVSLKSLSLSALAHILPRVEQGVGIMVASAPATNPLLQKLLAKRNLSVNRVQRLTLAKRVLSVLVRVAWVRKEILSRGATQSKCFQMWMRL